MEVYSGTVYRPPSESRSLIIQITLGCSHNRCTFCSMYKDKQFTIKSLERIKTEIDYFRTRVSYAQRVFLADGDAMIIPTEKLLEIIAYIKKVFPECKRISAYASPKSIMLKSDEELKQIRESGISMLYMGLESGDDTVLEKIKKGVNSNKLIEVCKRIKRNGYVLSVTLIAGLLGQEDWSAHAINSGKLISRIEPDYVGILSLMLEEGTEIYSDYLAGKFKEADGVEILQEIRVIIENIDVTVPIIFRANHASNYLSLGGTLPQDKKKLLTDIDSALKNYNLKSKEYRLL